MKRLVVALTLASGVGIGIGMTGNQVLIAQQEGIKRTVIIRTDLVGLVGKEGLMWVAEIPPGGRTGKHYHPGHEFVFTLEGSGVIEEQGKPPVTLKPGVAFHLQSSSEKAEYVHEAINTSKTEPLKLLAVLITEKGQPPAIPVK